MENKELERTRQIRLARLRYLIRQVKPFGYTATSIVEEAGVRPSTVNRKLSGADRSIIKTQTLATIEKAASKIVGKPLGNGEALVAELEATNDDIAEAVDIVIRTLVKEKVIREDAFPERLRKALARRRQLLELLGLPST